MDALAVGALALSAVASAAVYDRLPIRVATHFDLHGHANGWMPRPLGAFFLPAFGLALWALLRFAARLVPPVGGKSLDAALSSLVAMLTAVFLALVHVLVLGVAVRPDLRPMSALAGAMGVFWIVLGLVMPRLRRNALVGIRTPWTLADDENWARTHRFAGYTMCAGGVVATLAFVVLGAASMPLAIATCLASALAPAVYSFALARAQRS